MRLPLQRLLSTMATPIEDALRQKARTTQLPYPTYLPIYPSIHPSIRIHYVLLLLTHPIHSFISLVYIYILQITAALSPTKLVVYNDSHQHAHHRAMAGNTSRETHFRLV